MTRVVGVLVVIAAIITVSACGPGTAPAADQSSQSSAGNTVTQSPSGSGSPAPATSGATAPTTSGPAASATSGTSSANALPGDFELGTPFTNFTSDNDVTQTEEEYAFEHVIFFFDSEPVVVVDGNLSGQEIVPTETVNSDGSVTIGYSESTESATINFTGTLANDTMQVKLNVDQVGGDVVDGTEYIGAGNGTITFDAPVVLIPDISAIPGPPQGGSCGYSSDYGVLLGWNPPLSGNASAYDIYAVINTSATDVSFQGRTASPSYDDESTLAKINDGGTMSYEIYSVGPTGLEGTTPMIVTLTGLPGATAPICSYTS